MSPARPRRQLYGLLEGGHPARAAGLIEFLMCVLIVANVLAVATETVPSMGERYAVFFHWFEVLSVAVFTIEYGLRLWVAPEHPPLTSLPGWRARLRVAATPYAVIDLLAIAPFYLSFLIPLDLRVLRMFRLLRLLKLARYSPALGTIWRVIQTEQRALAGSFVIMLVLVLLSATLVYYAEHRAQPETFSSIPAAVWWAVATLTTVGYGDAVPVTLAGKLVGGVFMVCGLGMFALPIGILATGFAQEIHRRDFVVSWSTVARVPLFADLGPTDLVDLARMLRAETVEAGTVIARRGEDADSMYVIASGEAQFDRGDGSPPARLGTGAHVGVAALLGHTTRLGTLTALTRCRLMALDARDFHLLVSKHASIRRRLEPTS